MNSFHGTSSSIAKKLTAGTVDVKIGGGELGRGFYTGQYLHEAKAWAYQMYGDKQKNVVEFSNNDDIVETLSIKILDHGSAGLHRYRIRKAAATRTYQFDYDLIWAPIVGSERVSGDQYKWESRDAQDLLNGKETSRSIK